MKTTKYWVIKVGSSVLGGSGEINLPFIEDLAKEIKKQTENQQKVVLVTSGAISQGMKTLGIKTRPNSVSKLQALASIGQITIVSCFAKALNQLGLNAAQILLTAQDLSDRERYVNAKNTLKSLLDQGVVPVVNENDTISTQSIRFGDNDTLAALVANLVSAHYLVILTDQAGVYDKNPTKFKDAQLIRYDQSENASLNDIKGLDSKSTLGSGGMRTKINAVKTAAKSGTHTIIASGFAAGTVSQIFTDPKSTGSFFEASITPEKARKLWLGYALKPHGKIEVNLRAAKAISSNASLLAVGIVDVKGSFAKGDLVEVTYQSSENQDIEIARGIVNYDAKEIALIKGMNSEAIWHEFRFAEQEVIHRDNMLITAKPN